MKTLTTLLGTTTKYFIMTVNVNCQAKNAMASMPHQAKHSTGLLAFTRSASPTICLSVIINEVTIGSSIA